MERTLGHTTRTLD